MADGGLSLLIASTVASTGAGLYAQKSAENAAQAQSENTQNLLERKRENQRQALIENSERQQGNKQRYLAQVRASQAASGFNTSGGTALAIFGDIESSLDDQINEATSQALDAINTTRNQGQSLQFGDKLRAQAGGISRAAIGINAATSFGAGYGANYDRNDSDPFGFYKKQKKP
jgi:hypothetical protein